MNLFDLATGLGTVTFFQNVPMAFLMFYRHPELQRIHEKCLFVMDLALILKKESLRHDDIREYGSLFVKPSRFKIKFTQKSFYVS